MLLRSRFAIPIALACALLLPAVPAAAHDDDGWGGHGGRHGHYWHRDHRGHHRHHHRCGHRGWYGPRVVKHKYYGYPVHHYGYAPAAFCGPCGHYFASYDHLSHHVHHHHHIAVIELPFVIFQASLGGGVGWIYD